MTDQRHLTVEFERITGHHGAVIVEGESQQNDGDEPRYNVKAEHDKLNATVPIYALRHAHA
jgi:hypothetical protein